MKLTLEAVSRVVAGETHLYPLDLTLVPSAMTVLLGATRAGKTSLMRIMAGLDAPTRGRVLADGVDVTGVPVRQRQVAMVYQQFINYPSLTVADNIASPLRLRREANVDAVVAELAQRLRIDRFLHRLPAELSGGQQQRVALARALAKKAPLVLLDEPLANLDYKLREELREDLTRLFEGGESTVVYATTEPSEALLLGGYTAVMDAGRVLQYGPTVDVFNRPASVAVARAFSDPPMNLLAGTALGTGLTLPGGVALPLRRPISEQARQVQVGLRASDISVRQVAGDLELAAQVQLAEISGSDSYVHLDSAVGALVMQLPGVHRFEPGDRITVYVDPGALYLFDEHGQLAVLPERFSEPAPAVALTAMGAEPAGGVH